MIQALLTYPIVALAAAWVLWSIILPGRLRAALRRALGVKTFVCGMQGGEGGCGAGDCRGCPLAAATRAAPRAAPLAAVPRKSA